jgi:hypothetical protein
MGVKSQRKLYFLSISDKVLLCVDSGTTSPVDNPTDFLGRSDIPSTAKCIELKPNDPDSINGFCPNSGVIIPEKSYLDYDEATDTLIIQKAIADGNCGHTLSSISVSIKKERVYTFYVRALFVHNIIARFDQNSYNSVIRSIVSTQDHYYYVFSSLEGATNWDLTKMVHSPDEVMSILPPYPILSFDPQNPFPSDGRLNGFLMPTTNLSNIKQRYRLKGVPPSASTGAGGYLYQYQYNQYRHFDKYDHIDRVDSASYIHQNYWVTYGTNSIANSLLFRIYDSSLDPANSGQEKVGIAPFGASYVLWPLMYDKFINDRFDRYSIHRLGRDAQTGIIMEWASKLNGVYQLGYPGIYDPQMNVSIQINSVQIYPLERSNNQKLFLDDRFNYPPESSFPDFIPPIGYAMVPALYHSSLTNSLGSTYDQIKIDFVRIQRRLEDGGRVDIAVPGRFWGVNNNCDLVGLSFAGAIEGTATRNITQFIPDTYRNIFVQGGHKLVYFRKNDLNIGYLFFYDYVMRGQISLKYAIDMIYTVRISKDSIPSQPVETVNPPAVCPPVELSVRQHSDILL